MLSKTLGRGLVLPLVLMGLVSSAVDASGLGTTGAFCCY